MEQLISGVAPEKLILGIAIPGIIFLIAYLFLSFTKKPKIVKKIEEKPIDCTDWDIGNMEVLQLDEKEDRYEFIARNNNNKEKFYFFSKEKFKEKFEESLKEVSIPFKLEWRNYNKFKISLFCEFYQKNK